MCIWHQTYQVSCLRHDSHTSQVILTLRWTNLTPLPTRTSACAKLVKCFVQENVFKKGRTEHDVYRARLYRTSSLLSHKSLHAALEACNTTFWFIHRFVTRLNFSCPPCGCWASGTTHMKVQFDFVASNLQKFKRSRGWDISAWLQHDHERIFGFSIFKGTIRGCKSTMWAVLSGCHEWASWALRRSKFQDVFWGSNSPTMLCATPTAIQTLYAQQSPLCVPFSYSHSGSAHGNQYCSLTPEALPSLALTLHSQNTLW